MRAFSTIRRLSAAAALSAALLAPLPSFGQGAGHGPNTDDVTGWLCISPFCDMVVQPISGCLCRKDNPNETRASHISLTCLPSNGSGMQSCPTSGKIRTH